MSENNYGALMMKSSVLPIENIDQILSPGIYPINVGNTSSPDNLGGTLIVLSGEPVRRIFVSNSKIFMTATYISTSSSWSPWAIPLNRSNPFWDIKSDGTTAEALANLGLSDVIHGSKFLLPVAWARINGKTGGIVSSVGISSCTRNGVGQYTITFAKPMLNGAYAVVGSAGSAPIPDASWVARVFTAVVRQASAFSIITVDNNVDQYVDADVIDFCVFGEVS